MEIFYKILLILSILFIGMNLSSLTKSFNDFKEDGEEIKKIFKIENADYKHVISMHILIVSVLAIAYLTAAYFADFKNWVLFFMAAKFFMTIRISKKNIVDAVELETLPVNAFRISRLDKFLNVAMGLGVSYLCVV